MPRKPRRSGLSAPCPFTFSPFGRSISRASAACSSFNKSSNSKFDGLRANDPASASDSSEEEEAPEVSSSEEESAEEVVQADFAFFDPKPNNFHGVKTLLPNYLDDTQWDLSGFADIIIAQTTVGSVVRIEDDEDEGLFAFLTVLNLGRYKAHKCIAELKDYLLKVCPEDGPVGKLKILLGDDAQNVGLIVSQRVTNLPPQLLPPLYDALFDEISWATEDEPTVDLRKSFRFKHFLLVSRIYKKIARNKKGSASGSNEDVIYVKAEDELFHQLSSWSFTFPLRTQPPSAQELKDYRMIGLVMAVKADKAPTFRQQLRSLIDDS
ncbi:protein BCCIP homolog [Silene latifolia]|uniref:protein BCCIP homolog n=1 Tax=Silene latifolia TaxID=37657 RepID=UPI003D783CCB